MGEALERVQPVLDILETLATEAGTAPAIQAERFAALHGIIEAQARELDSLHRIEDLRHEIKLNILKLVREVMIGVAIVAGVWLVSLFS